MQEKSHENSVKEKKIHVNFDLLTVSFVLIFILIQLFCHNYVAAKLQKTFDKSRPTNRNERVGGLVSMFLRLLFYIDFISLSSLISLCNGPFLVCVCV